jgi:hypothetical protein
MDTIVFFYHITHVISTLASKNIVTPLVSNAITNYKYRYKEDTYDNVNKLQIKPTYDNQDC